MNTYTETKTVYYLRTLKKNNTYAGMAELADATDLKSVVSNGVWVQVPLPAPKPNICEYIWLYH